MTTLKKLQSLDLSILLTPKKEFLGFDLEIFSAGEKVGFASADLALETNEISDFDADDFDAESFDDLRKNWLFVIEVNAEQQGKGYARILLQALEKAVATVNALLGVNYSLLGSVHAGKGLTQAELVEFYERYGFDVENDENQVFVEGGAGNLFFDDLPAITVSASEEEVLKTLYKKAKEAL